MTFQGPFPGGLGTCRLSITSHLANRELEAIELPFRNKRREQNGSLQSEPFLGGSTPAKGNFGSLFGLGKMRLETVKPGQSFSHNGGQPSPAGLGPMGPRRGLKATLGRRESKSAPAEEAAAESRGLPHDDPLPLHVHLVQSQLVRERHLGNSAAARGRGKRLCSDSGRDCSRLALGTRGKCRAPSGPSRPASHLAPPLSGRRTLLAGHAGSYRTRPEGACVLLLFQGAVSLRGRRRDVLLPSVTSGTQRAAGNLRDQRREAVPPGPQVEGKGEVGAEGRTWRESEVQGRRLAPYGRAQSSCSAAQTHDSLGKSATPHAPRGIARSRIRIDASGSSFWKISVCLAPPNGIFRKTAKEPLRIETS